MGDFTKYFCDGFVLTLRAFGGKIPMPRERIATAAVTSWSAPKRDNSIAIDPVETGFHGQPGVSRETPILFPDRRNP